MADICMCVGVNTELYTFKFSHTTALR